MTRIYYDVLVKFCGPWLVRVGLNCRRGLSLCLVKQWTIKKEGTITNYKDYQTKLTLALRLKSD